MQTQAEDKLQSTDLGELFGPIHYTNGAGCRRQTGVDYIAVMKAIRIINLWTLAIVNVEILRKMS